jgi:hypothetical protein
MKRASSIAVAVIGALSCGPEREPAFIDSPALSESLVRDCARVIACTASPYRTTSHCLYVNAFARTPAPRGVLSAPRFVPTACLASALDCKAVQACASGETGGSCDDASVGRSNCDSARVISCDTNRKQSQLDCRDDYPGSGANAVCVVGTDGNGACGTGTCSSPTTTSRCEGNTVVACDNGIQAERPCTDGLVCRLEGETAECGGAGAACSGPERCEGDVLLSCRGGHEHRTDCKTASTLPLACGSHPAIGEAACRPSLQLRCDPLTFVDRCAGAELIYCDGQERRLDCGRIGFRACAQTGGQAARCE